MLIFLGPYAPYERQLALFTDNTTVTTGPPLPPDDPDGWIFFAMLGWDMRQPCRQFIVPLDGVRH